jgi:hypothetical protein
MRADRQITTDPEKARPIDPHRPHRRARYGEPAQTGLSGSRSAAAHRNGRSAATQVPPPLPSRTASTASSMSRGGRALVLRAACSEPQDIDRRPRRAGRGAAFEARDNPDGSLMNCAARCSTASSSRRNHHRCMLPPLGALTRAIARVKSRSQYEIAFVCQRFEPDTAAMLAKASRPQKIVFAQVKNRSRVYLGRWRRLPRNSRGLDVFLTGKRPLIFAGVGDDIPNAEEECGRMRLSNE